MKLNKSDFTKNLIRINSLQFNKWLFEPDMLFMSEYKWWGNKGKRDKQHNGLDLLSYEAEGGKHKILDAETKIPIIYDGRIVRCIKDFLGYSLFAEHEIHEGESRLFTIYGHVQQTPDILIGDPVSEGTVIASLPIKSGVLVPGHLHISIAFISKSIPNNTLSWKMLSETENIHFLDPRLII
jgi:murein DD-endopeptidase MepM/ murein hydrolase activator NlpD